MSGKARTDRNKKETAPVEKDGAGRRSAVKYSFLKILTGSDLSRRRLARMQANGRRPGPTVWLTACGHGDEVGGVVVVQEVFKRLRKQPLLRGQLHAFPLMNPLGFEVSSRHVAFSGEDLNRCFPGHPQGSLAQRIAHMIFTEIARTRPALVLDLHNDWRHSIPYTLIDPPPGPAHEETHARARDFAPQTGFLLVAESSESSDGLSSPKTLSGSLIRRGIPSLTVELGEAYVVNERNVEFGVRAIWNCLAGLAMVDADAEPFRYPAPERFRGRFLTYYGDLVSSTSGIIRFRIKPGDVIAARQPVARIYNAFGKLLETISVPHAGIVLGHSDSSVAYPGVPVAAFGLERTNSN
jgi:predicted deacylase